MMMNNFFKSWRQFTRIDEGGNKSPKTRGVVLTPELVKKTVAVYERVIADWSEWLVSQGEEPVRALRPVGSVSYYEKDLEEKPGTVYGDIDYLVELPLPGEFEDDTEKRKNQNAQKRKYTQLFVDYLNSGATPPEVDVKETLKGNVMLVILELGNGVFVQADTVTTFPDYGEWIGSRYTPERGIKGYAMGHLYTSLGDYFPLSIGTEGVIARTQDGRLVTGKVRKGVTIQTISTDPRNFLIDIAKYFAGEGVKVHPILRQASGVDPESVSIESLARGIKGLALTLGNEGITDAGEMIEQVKNTYKGKLEGNVDQAYKRDRPAADIEKEVMKLTAVNNAAWKAFMKGIEG